MTIWEIMGKTIWEILGKIIWETLGTIIFGNTDFLGNPRTITG